MKNLAPGMLLFCTTSGLLAQPLDHAPFDALLRVNVSNGVVNYPGFQNNAAFRNYIDARAVSRAFAGKNDELAYYINAYNALAIEGILQGLSPASLLGRARYFKFKALFADIR